VKGDVVREIPRREAALPEKIGIKAFSGLIHSHRTHHHR